MTYTLSSSRDGEIIVRLGVSADEALAIVGRAIPNTGKPQAQPDGPQRRGPKSSKPGKRTYNRKPVNSDLMQEAARRHPATDQIEQMLIEGATVAEILEKVEVSSPTVYVIRTRLRKEGRLTA